MRRDEGVSGLRAGSGDHAGGPVAGCVPGVGDLLTVEGGPAYRVLGAVATATPGSYRLDGYEIHERSGGPVVRVRPYLWRDGWVAPADQGDDGRGAR